MRVKSVKVKSPRPRLMLAGLTPNEEGKVLVTKLLF